MRLTHAWSALRSKAAALGSGKVFRETILGPVNTALPWLARIRSSLLLKTAS
jgi:hypothetical protein